MSTEQTNKEQKEVKKGMQIAKAVVANACRLLLAATFLFSGFVKANDPMGTVYKFHDYLAAVSLDVIPDTILLCSAVLLAIFEFMLGINLLFWNSKRTTISLTTMFMTVMTILTVYIYIANPVSDCGCFGDALILSNGATLAKNIVLLIAINIVTAWRKHIWDKVPATLKGFVSLVALCGIFGYAVTCIIKLPRIDFRPYKVGLNLREAVENASASYDVKIIYERNGEKLELSLDDDDPDSTWTYVETRKTEIENNDLAVADFCVSDLNGDEVTDDLLYDEGFSFLLIIPDLTNADEGCIDRVNEMYDWATSEQMAFHCLTASVDETAHNYWRDHTGAEYDFLIADDRLLKTIVRGNPGLVLMHDGVILAKWSNFNMPGEDDRPIIQTKYSLTH